MTSNTECKRCGETGVDILSGGVCWYCYKKAHKSSYEKEKKKTNWLFILLGLYASIIPLSLLFDTFENYTAYVCIGVFVSSVVTMWFIPTSYRQREKAKTKKIRKG